MEKCSHSDRLEILMKASSGVLSIDEAIAEMRTAEVILALCLWRCCCALTCAHFHAQSSSPALPLYQY